VTRESTLLKQARMAVSDRLEAFVSRGLNTLPAELEELQYASNVAEEKRLLARAIEQVRTRRSALEREFVRAFEIAFERKLTGVAPTDELSLDALTLVDDSAIELEIAMGRLVRKTIEEIDPGDLYGIEARIGELAAGKFLDSAHNPLGVEVAMEALNRACNGVDEDGAVRMAVANGLQPHVAAGLRNGYQEANNLLVAAGIQPRLQYHVERARDVGVAKAGAPAVPQGMVVSQALNLRDLLPVSTGTMVDIAAVVGAMMAGAPEKRRSGARILSNPKGMLYQAAVQTPVDPGLLRALSEALAAARQGGGGGGDGAAAGGVEALRNIAPQAAHPLDQLTGDLVANVFEQLQGDAELPDVVRQEIDRLPPAAFKAAVIDRSFFANPEHPARRFLGNLSTLAADPEVSAAPDGEFMQELRSVIQTIAANEGADLAVYDEATTRLQAAAERQVETRRAEHEKHAAELERAERYEVALAASRAAVHARLADWTPPEFVRGFLEGPWAEAIASADADHCVGEDGPDRLLAAVDDLLWTLTPKSATDVQAMIAMLPRVVRDLQRGTAKGMEAAARQTFFENLMRRHTELLQQARRLGEQVPQTPRVPRANADATLPYSAAMPAMLPPVMSRGALADLEEDGVARRVRLTWVSPRGANYLFTSGDGPAKSYTREAVMRMIGAGMLRMIEARPSAAERAIAAVAG
jgi:Protein of unknown function (DUF1631)